MGTGLMRDLHLPDGSSSQKLPLNRDSEAGSYKGGGPPWPRATAASGISDSCSLRHQLSPEMVPCPPCVRRRVKNRDRCPMLSLKAWIFSVLGTARKGEASWEASGHENQEMQWSVGGWEGSWKEWVCLPIAWRVEKQGTSKMG